MLYSPEHAKYSPELFEKLYTRSKQLLSWTRKKVDIIETYIFRDKESQEIYGLFQRMRYIMLTLE